MNIGACSKFYVESEKTGSNFGRQKALKVIYKFKKDYFHFFVNQIKLLTFYISLFI
jgi:hypothetical protein